MNYIITSRDYYFKLIGNYNYCTINEIILPDKIAIDTETTGLECYHTKKGFRGADLFAIQIGTGTNNYLFDLEGGITPQQVFKLIEGKTLVLQNAIFDIRFMLKHGFIPTKIRDTFLASKIIYNGGRDGVYTHNFGALMSRELEIEYDKSEQKNIAKVKLSNTKAIQYCFNDVDRLMELEDALVKKLELNNQYEAYDVQCNACLPLAYMEMCGMPLDGIKWSKKIEGDKIQIAAVETTITEYIINNLPKYEDRQMEMFANVPKIYLNLNSTKQMIPVFKDLGLNVLNDKGKESLNEKVVSKNKHEFVDFWKKRQSLQKSLSTFGQNVLDRATEGRIYTSFNPMVDTSRISCRKGGINFLNFPANKLTRDAFTALKGFKMVGADYSGQENATGADMHKDPAMVKSITEGSCLHCAFTRVLFSETKDLSDAEIKKDFSHLRQQAKAPRFLFSYGGSAYTLHTNEGIPMKRATEIETGFKELHEGIYKWGTKNLILAMKTGFIESTAGFKLYLPYFDEFKEVEAWYKTLDKEFWNNYSLGKNVYKTYYKLKDIKERTDAEEIKFKKIKALFNEPFSIIYSESKHKVSKYAKLKAEYFKLCLNNPAQSMAAFQTKSALIALFDIIVERNELWEARISNSPYDEILMEVKEDLAEDYKLIMEKCMVEEGNKWLKSGLFSMEADAVIGSSWYDCH